MLAFTILSLMKVADLPSPVRHTVKEARSALDPSTTPHRHRRYGRGRRLAILTRLGSNGLLPLTCDTCIDLAASRILWNTRAGPVPTEAP
jgi:hypothetical protein